MPCCGNFHHFPCNRTINSKIVHRIFLLNANAHSGHTFRDRSAYKFNHSLLYLPLLPFFLDFACRLPFGPSSLGGTASGGESMLFAYRPYPMGCRYGAHTHYLIANRDFKYLFHVSPLFLRGRRFRSDAVRLMQCLLFLFAFFFFFLLGFVYRKQLNAFRKRE